MVGLLGAIALVGWGGFVLGERVGRRRSSPAAAGVSPAMGGLCAALDRVRGETGCRGAALYDGDGRLLGAVGGEDHERTGAWVGLLGTLLGNGRELGLCGAKTIFSLQDQVAGDLCCSTLDVDGRPVILTTAGARGGTMVSAQSLSRITALLRDRGAT